jgi:hypothetical protein
MSAAPASAQVSIGITIGQPPPPQVYRVPARPSPDFTWVDGYWYPQGKHYKWHDGYWTRPPFAGAYWVEPYYQRGQYFQGYWDGSHGRFDHRHEWDHDRDRRDEHRYDRHDDHGDHDDHDDDHGKHR